MVMDDDAIWRKHKEELVRYATTLVGASDAEDVLSSVVTRVLRRRRLAELDDARSYLFRAVLNEARSVRRRSGRLVFLPEPEILLPEVRPDVVDAVAALSERQRAAVYLVYWRDLPIGEVAELMGCRPGTVKRYLHLARNRLAEVLDE